MEFRCIWCGFRIRNNKALFVQYSPGNIRLMRCESCKAVADEYIEREIMNLLIDLILYKPKAYRHLLYNLLNQQVVNLEGLFWKSLFVFLLLDAYRIVFLNWSEEGWGLSMSFSTLILRCGKMLMDLLFGNFMFLCSLLLATKFILGASAGVSWYKDILLAIFITSYFNIFLIAMMVWEFPSSVLFIIDIFVLSSNTVALKVITESSISKCIGACFCAHAVKFLVRSVPSIICQNHRDNSASLLPNDF
ncbi:Protein arv1 like isoform 2 [Actinidia chinensis var. chinensis]|uniref:Protein ARV n=1 Tax=Actinidia chinensis var. chinensis TaxID=1590841 RepID=A0A2R6QB21_ACTCC|nr:Protein arv1 like isoform 2 [Actinidia chinensis var. chinensis]